jgi:hypothetical protein
VDDSHPSPPYRIKVKADHFKDVIESAKLHSRYIEEPIGKAAEGLARDRFDR